MEEILEQEKELDSFGKIKHQVVWDEIFMYGFVERQ